MKNMIVQTKEQYTSPRSEEQEIKLEGVIAASPDVSPSNPFSGNTEKDF